MEISKELISKVLEIDKRLLRIDEIKENHIFFYTMSNVGEYQNYINIYELAFKCKEWVYNEGYMMKIENHYLNSIQIQIRKPTANSMNKEPWKKTFKNEIDGMIQVCQWILDNK